MILVTIAVLMADTTPLTSTDTVTAVGEHTQLMMTQNKYSINDFVTNLLLLLNSPITVDPLPPADCTTDGDCEQLEQLTCSTTMMFINNSYDKENELTTCYRGVLISANQI